MWLNVAYLKQVELSITTDVQEIFSDHSLPLWNIKTH